MNRIALGLVSASIIGAGIFVYLKIIKKKIKKYVLRNEHIEKYFKEEQ